MITLYLLIIKLGFQEILLQGPRLKIVFRIAELPFQKADDHAFLAHPTHVIFKVGEPSAFADQSIIDFGSQMQEAFLFGFGGGTGLAGLLLAFANALLPFPK